MSPIDLAGAEFHADPYPTYRRMREEAPCYRLFPAGPTGSIWFVTRYADVARVLRDPLLSKSLARVIPPERLSLLDRSMISRDPPDHTRLRSLVSQAFTPARVQEMEPRMAALAEGLLTGLRGRDEADFMTEFALPFPVAVIGELLGVPPQDRPRFAAWSAAYLRDADATLSDAAGRARQREALGSLGDYLASLIRERRGRPGDDLVSSLLRARERDDRLSEEELLGTCLLLLLAGAETTVNLIGNGLLTLLRHPDAMQRLRAEPSLLGPAVEEVLRYESPVQRATFRVATREVVIAGRRIPEGEQVSAVIGAANRDPNQFSDPDRFHLRREPNRHLSFGLGPHYCLGASLARVEARIAFGAVLRLFPRLQGGAEPRWGASSIVRGLRSLPIRPGSAWKPPEAVR